MPGPIERQADQAPLRDLGPYLRGRWVTLGVVALLSLIGAGLAVAQPLVVQWLVDTSARRAPVGSPVRWLVAITLLDTLLGAVRHYLLERTAESVVLGVRRSLVGRLLALSVRTLDRHRVGDLVARAGSDTTLLRSVITSGVVEVASSVLMFVGAVVLMAVLDLVLFAITLAVVLVGCVAVAILALTTRTASSRVQESVGSMSADLQRSLTAIRTVKAAGAEAHERSRVEGSVRDAYEAGVQLAKIQAFIRPIMQTCVQAAMLVVLAVGGARVAQGSMELGQLIAFILYMFLLVMPLIAATTAFLQVQVGLAALDRIQQVMREPEETADEVGRALARSPRPTAQALEFDRVWFGHGRTPEGGPGWVLQDVSFVVPTGSRVAVVGPSGAGKTTLLALVERFYDADQGCVRLHGVPVTDLPRAKVRSCLALVEQDAPVVGSTLQDNLRLLARDATDEQLLEVLHAVGLDDLPRRSPEGLDLELGERGVMLSGGQRQRLSWARALLSDRPVLLLDEPTSAVDARTEDRLRSALTQFAEGRTVVAIAHRLASVADFDQIVVLDDGRVVGQGRHDELLRECSVYHDLARRQGLVR